jgi:hypothetical protein
MIFVGCRLATFAGKATANTLTENLLDQIDAVSPPASAKR